MNEQETQWSPMTLGSVADLNPPRPKLAGRSRDLPVLFVPMAAVDDVTGEVVAAETKTLAELADKSYRTFTSNDVLFAKITPCMENGKAAVVPVIPSGLGFGSTEFHVLRPKPGIEARFLWHFVRQEHFRRAAEQQMTGSVGQLRVPSAFLEDFPIAVPDEDTQRAIVHLLDETLEASRSARIHVSSALKAVERFRESVLAAACSGALTEDWRDENGAAAWTEQRAEDVCSKVQSGTTPKVWHGSDGVPFIKVYNIVDQKLNFDYRPQFISERLHRGALSRARALPGDVLMNIVGPPLGKVAIVTDQYPEWSINQALTLFRPSARITSQWLYIFLSSGISLRQVIGQTRGTAGQANISLSQCRDFPVPVPSVEEQIEIVRRVAEMFDLADMLRTRIEKVLQTIGRSSQAALSKAFRGELLNEAGPS